jgi:hypothetical protein
MNMRRRQGGITLLGFIIVAAVVGFFVYIGIKLFPMYSEFYSVKSALKGLSTEAGVARYEPARIQDLLFRRLFVSYTSNVKREHVKITRIDNGWQVDVQYEVRKPLIANLDVVGKFHATQQLTRAGDVN